MNVRAAINGNVKERENLKNALHGTSEIEKWGQKRRFAHTHNAACRRSTIKAKGANGSRRAPFLSCRPHRSERSPSNRWNHVTLRT